MNITATLIIQMIAFAIFIILINKILYKPLSNLMIKRQKRIEDGLIAAERGQAEKKEAEEKAKKIIDQSKLQAGEIIVNAQKQANSIVSEAKETAKLEAGKIKESAHQEIHQEVGRVKKTLQSQLAALVALGVSKIINKEIDQNTHQKILSDLSQSL